ncbi:unnamed protein product [Pedinophyceae sp. YPF-701]|nr:unnamed protein product [Pedinophyceae sp. YPF-701]
MLKPTNLHPVRGADNVALSSSRRAAGERRKYYRDMAITVERIAQNAQAESVVGYEWPDWAQERAARARREQATEAFSADFHSWWPAFSAAIASTMSVSAVALRAPIAHDHASVSRRRSSDGAHDDAHANGSAAAVGAEAAAGKPAHFAPSGLKLHADASAAEEEPALGATSESYLEHLAQEAERAGAPREHAAHRHHKRHRKSRYHQGSYPRASPWVRFAEGMRMALMTNPAAPGQIGVQLGMAAVTARNGGPCHGQPAHA